MEDFSTRMAWPDEQTQAGGEARAAEASVMEDDVDDDDEDDEEEEEEEDEEDFDDSMGWGAKIASTDGCRHHQSRIFLSFVKLICFCF